MHFPECCEREFSLGSAPRLLQRETVVGEEDDSKLVWERFGRMRFLAEGVWP